MTRQTGPTRVRVGIGLVVISLLAIPLPGLASSSDCSEETVEGRDYVVCEGEGSHATPDASQVAGASPIESSGTIGIAATQSCTYDNTVFAYDEREGDAKTAYSSGLSAHAASHAARGGTNQPAWVTESSHAYVTVGHALRWDGSNVRQGRVRMPWGIIGNLRTATEFSGLPFPTITSASAGVRLYIGVFNRNTGERQEALVTSDSTSGNSQKQFGDRYDKPGGFWVFAVTYTPGQVLEPYLRLESWATARGSAANPGLTADALSDFLGRVVGEYGAELEHVEYEVDLPDGWSLICS